MIALRPASPADVPLLEAWDRQPHVIAAGGDWSRYDDWDWSVEVARTLDWRELLIGMRDGRAIGVIQIIDPAREESRYWGDVPAGLRAIDIWIGEADALGQGHGREMMRLAVARCFADPAVQAIVIDPLLDNARAQRFYARLGFATVGPRRFSEDDCLAMRLERSAWPC